MAGRLIHPRQVSSDAWRNWIRQGFELVSRKWPAWIAVMTPCCLLTGAAGTAEPIAQFLTLAIGFNLAVAADHEPDWPGMASRFGSLFREAVKFGWQVGMFVLVVSIPLDTAMSLSETVVRAEAAANPGIREIMGSIAGVVAAASDSPTLLAQIYEESANNLVAWAMLLPVGLGFLYPLRSLGAGFYAALAYGGNATALNRRSVLLIALLSFASVLAFVALRLYPLIPIALGFWMAVNYVMFRDIFLGIPENRPARAKAARRVEVGAAA